MENERKIVSPKRGDDDLFIQPHKSGPERERDEQHNRDGGSPPISTMPTP